MLVPSNMHQLIPQAAGQPGGSVDVAMHGLHCCSATRGVVRTMHCCNAAACANKPLASLKNGRQGPQEYPRNSN